jgi:hypothetical protein
MTETSIKHELSKYIEEKHKGTCRKITPKEIINIVCKDSIIKIKQILPIELQMSFPIMIHCFINDIRDIPKCFCGEILPFNNSDFRFAKYCCNKCRFENAEETVKIRQETNLEKYGKTNYLATSEGKKKIEETSMLKYGVKNHTQSQQYKDKVSGRIVPKISVERTRLILLKQSYETFKIKYTNCVPLFTMEEYEGVRGYRKYSWHCNTCDKDFISSIHNGCSPICSHCKPIGSLHELVCKKFLDDLNISYNFNDRKVLDSGKEIDLFIPHKNFGIELCGLYWHSTAGPYYAKMNHVTKLEECEELGIKLFTVYDDEMYDLNKRRIVFNKIKNVLGLTKRKIYARKCQIIELAPNTCTKFLEKYHIQGTIGASYRYGLTYKNKLVAVMTFNKGRTATGHTAKDNEWELGRYCSIFNFSIVGGASKLVTHFIRTINPEVVYSYADRRWSNGGVYEKLGFSFIKNSAPNYWYTRGFKTREHRVKYRKHSLRDFPSYDENLSEHEIMLKEGFYRTWDCGSKLYTWKKQ